MFKVKIVSKTDTKTMTLDEAQLTKHVLGFVVYQAKKNGEATTTVVNGGESYVWHITYLKPN